MATQTADFWIQHLQLSQHIEGGWYTEVYRSSLVLDKGNLPAGFKGERNACTHIYFLLEKKGSLPSTGSCPMSFGISMQATLWLFTR